MIRPVAGLLALVMGVWALSLTPAAATQKNTQQGSGDQQGGGIRNVAETSLDFLPLAPADGQRLRIERLHVLTPQGSVTLVAGDGVLRRDENRLDLGGVPLLGQLFSGDRVSASDLHADARLGSAFVEGGNLAIVLPQAGGLTAGTPVVLNRDYSYRLQGPRGPLDATDLAIQMPRFAAIPVVSRLLAGQPQDGDDFVLGGLTKQATRASPDIPAFGDTPLLQQFFAGSVHAKDEASLLILIRPSIILGNE